MTPSWTRIGIAATAYLGIVFTTGFVLGFLRVLFVVPFAGAFNAELLEAPFMFVAIVASARWIVRRFLWEASILGTFVVGWSAAVGVLILDIVVGTQLRGMTVAEVFMDRNLILGSVYYGLIVAYAWMPWLMKVWLENRSLANRM